MITNEEKISKKREQTTSTSSKLFIQTDKTLDKELNSTTTNWKSPVEIVNYYKNLEHWDRILPKTDNTYSHTSKFYNRAIAPGIPLIPNMSRYPISEVQPTKSTSFTSISNTKNIITSANYFTTNHHISQSTSEKHSKVIRNEHSINNNNSWSSEAGLFRNIIMSRIRKSYSNFINHRYGDWIIRNTTIIAVLMSLLFILGMFMFVPGTASVAWDTLMSGIYTPCSLIAAFLYNVIDVFNYIAFSTLAYASYVKTNFYDSHSHSTTIVTQSEPNYDVSSIKSIIKEEIDLIATDLKQDIQAAVKIAVSKRRHTVIEKRENFTRDELNEITDRLVKEATIKIVERAELISSTCPNVSNSNSLCEYTTNTDNAVSITKDYINDAIERALKMYDADKTAMVDYALETSGGEILSTRCTESLSPIASFSLLGFPLWYTRRNPRVVIQPGVYPGECWSFAGSTGFLVIKLSRRIFVTGFHMEHIPQSLAPNGNISSAPKDFSVWGLNDETDKDPRLLGQFTFHPTQNSLQYFAAEKQKDCYEIVELKIESNHGKSEYTCLYRFRVHGILSTDYND